MAVGTLARFNPISGPRVPVKVIANGRDQYGPVTVLRVTSRPTGSPYRKGDTVVVSLGSVALATR